MAALAADPVSGTSQEKTVLAETRLDGLSGVKPGDRVTFTIRDEATGQRQVVTAVVSDATAAEAAPGQTVLVKEAGTAVEFINLDPVTRKVSVLGERGEKQVVVDQGTLNALSGVKPGQKVFLSHRFDEAGRTEARVRVAPTPGPPAETSPGARAARLRNTVRLERGTTAEVVAADAAARTVTVRTDAGESRTLAVDEATARELAGLRTGDVVVVTLDGATVVVLGRK
jgi:hypothetical protein